jgi:hypothetical protein
MALYVTVEVDFEDAGPFVVTKSYELHTTLGDDGTGMAQVITDAATLITDLDAVTWDHIKAHRIIVEIPDTGAAANVAANNSVELFCRCLDSVTGEPTHVIIPAWDDLVYDKNPNGSVSAALNAVAATVVGNLFNPKTHNPLTYVDAQNRATKRGQRQFKP